MLILSCFTGAARELRDALQINPYDIDQTAEAIRAALEMPPEEKQMRMQRMRKLVRETQRLPLGGKSDWRAVRSAPGLCRRWPKIPRRRLRSVAIAAAAQRNLIFGLLFASKSDHLTTPECYLLSLRHQPDADERTRERKPSR